MVPISPEYHNHLLLNSLQYEHSDLYLKYRYLHNLVKENLVFTFTQ